MPRDIPETRTESGNNVLKAGLDFFESMGHAAIVQPVQSVEQIVGQLDGHHVQIQPQKDTTAGGLEGAASRAGEMIGSALPGLAAALVVNKFVPLAGESRLATFATGSAFGFGYSALFNPVVGDSNNFWESKFKNAAVSGLTVGAASGLLGPSVPAESRLANFSNRAFDGFRAGLGAGAVNAVSDSLINNHPLTAATLFDRTVTYGVTGAALAGLGGAMEKPEAGKATETAADNAKPSEVSKANAAETYPEGYIPQTIGRDPEDGSIVIIDKGKAASFKDGQWQPGVQFSNSRIYDDFRQIRDPKLIAQLMQQASAALRDSEKK